MNESARPSRRVARSRWLAGRSRVLAEIVAGSLLLAVLVAVAWPRLAPDVVAEVLDNGVGFDALEARRLFGAEGWFAVLAAGAGLVLGVASFARHHARPVTTLLSLAVSGCAAALLAERVGRLLGPGPLRDAALEMPPGTPLPAPLELRAEAILFVWPIAATVGALLVAAFLDDRRPWHDAPAARLNPIARSEPSSRR